MPPRNNSSAVIKPALVDIQKEWHRAVNEEGAFAVSEDGSQPIDEAIATHAANFRPDPTGTTLTDSSGTTQIDPPDDDENGTKFSESIPARLGSTNTNMKYGQDATHCVVFSGTSETYGNSAKEQDLQIKDSFSAQNSASSNVSRSEVDAISDSYCYRGDEGDGSIGEEDEVKHQNGNKFEFNDDNGGLSSLGRHSFDDDPEKYEDDNSNYQDNEFDENGDFIDDSQSVERDDDTWNDEHAWKESYSKDSTTSDNEDINHPEAFSHTNPSPMLNATGVILPEGKSAKSSDISPVEQSVSSAMRGAQELLRKNRQKRLALAAKREQQASSIGVQSNDEERVSVKSPTNKVSFGLDVTEYHTPSAAESNANSSRSEISLSGKYGDDVAGGTPSAVSAESLVWADNTVSPTDKHSRRALILQMAKSRMKNVKSTSPHNDIEGHDETVRDDE